MDTKKLLMLINYLRFSASKVVREFLPRVMLMFGSFLWVSLCSFIFDLLGFIIKYISRLNNYATPGENAASVGATHCLSDDHTVQSPCKVLYSDGFEENEKVLNQNRAKTEDSVFKQYELISSQSKYQFLSSKDVSAFIVEPKVFKFTVEEMFVGSNDVGIQNQVTQFQPQENFRVLDESSKNVSKKSDEFVQCFCFEKNVEGPEEEPSVELIILDAENIEITDNSEQNQDFSEELISLKGDKICLSSVEYDDEILNHETSTTSDEREVEKSNKSTEADGGCFEGGTIVCIQGEENYYDGFIELKPYFEDHGDDNVEKVSQENVNKFEGSCEVENIFKERQEFEKNLQKFEENSDKNLGDIDSQEDEFDILQEHKYLVKQMKMDMRYSKVKGLPTISEEFESQKTFMDDLKPLHIDQKLGYKDHMAEIQMFYGRYAEKMKKLDILNYQTLHAIKDCLKDRNAAEVEVQISVSLAELAEMIQQLMQVFWEFVSTEKTGSKIKSKTGTEVAKHDHVEAKLLEDIRATLQQKERRLKDIQRRKNCIVKKFQKYQNCAQNHAVLTSQVELKLVSRVLCLTKISTDQLMWCQRKLDNISFLGRNVHVEHSFFLFPC